MPSNQFEVKQYEVQIQPHYGFNPYDIHLFGPEMSHGIQHKAALDFEDDPDDDGHVSNVRAQNYEGHQVSAMIDTAFFDRIYRVLQTEDPVNFHYWYESDDSTYRDLSSAQVMTSEEPIGEGLQDE